MAWRCPFCGCETVRSYELVAFTVSRGWWAGYEPVGILLCECVRCGRKWLPLGRTKEDLLGFVGRLVEGAT